MPSDPGKPPVRIRVRSRPPAGSGRPEERLVADRASPTRRKRKPNAGSMKPGETRNPKGRPKGAKGTRAMVRKVMCVSTAVRENGRERKITRFEAILLQELQLASQGDWRARKTVIELGLWALPEDEPDKPSSSGSREPRLADEAIINWFENEAGTRGRQTGGSPDEKREGTWQEESGPEDDE